MPFYTFGALTRYVLAFALLLLVCCSSEAAKSVYYFLEVSAEGARTEVRLNDIPITSVAGPVDVRLPVNLWIVSGANRLSCILSPLRGADTLPAHAKCSIALVVQSKSSRGASSEKLGEVSYFVGDASTPTSTKLIRSKDGSIEATNTLQVKTPFPRWLWETGDKISASMATTQELLKEVRAFWNLLKAKRKDEAFARLEYKLREIQTAEFQTREKARKRLMIGALIDDDDVKLEDLYTDSLKLEVFGSGRLAKLVAEEDGNSILSFVEKDQSLAYYIPLVFCRNEGRWVIIR